MVQEANIKRMATEKKLDEANAKVVVIVFIRSGTVLNETVDSAFIVELILQLFLSS